MGGKNPTVIMPSADIGTAAKIVGVGAFGTTGQSCTATSRAIVHEAVYDEFVNSTTEYAESIVVRDGLEHPDMGLHISESGLRSILEYIDIGLAEGWTLKTGAIISPIATTTTATSSNQLCSLESKMMPGLHRRRSSDQY